MTNSQLSIADIEPLQGDQSFKVRHVNGEFWTIAEVDQDAQDEVFLSIKLAADAIKEFLSETRGLSLGYTADDVEIVRVDGDGAEIQVLTSSAFEEFLLVV